MRLEDILVEKNIVSELKASEKRDLLDEMVEVIVSFEKSINRDELLEVLLEREQLGSTGIGHGVAIPHGKISGLKQIIVAFGRSKTGIDFQSMDEKPVYLFFMIIAPENSTAAHLKVLSQISSILKDSAMRKKLTKAGSSKDIYSIIIEADRNLQ